MPDVSTTFTWNFDAFLSTRLYIRYVARAVLAKSKQQFTGHVNVAPFRARLRLAVLLLSGAKKLLSCFVPSFELSNNILHNHEVDKRKNKQINDKIIPIGEASISISLRILPTYDVY